MIETLNNLDTQFFYFINGHHCAVMDWVMWVLSARWSWLIVIVAAFCFSTLRHEPKRWWIVLAGIGLCSTSLPTREAFNCSKTPSAACGRAMRWRMSTCSARVAVASTASSPRTQPTPSPLRCFSVLDIGKKTGLCLSAWLRGHSLPVTAGLIWASTTPATSSAVPCLAFWWLLWSTGLHDGLKKNCRKTKQKNESFVIYDVLAYFYPCDRKRKCVIWAPCRQRQGAFL